MLLPAIVFFIIFQELQNGYRKLVNYFSNKCRLLSYIQN